MAVNIGPRIGIDGEADYRKAINNIIQSTKTLKSEMAAVTSETSKSANPFKNLTHEISSNKQQRELLTQAIESQKAKLVDLQNMEQIAAEKMGEDATATLKWKQAVADSTTELNRMEGELNSLPSSFNIVGQAVQEVGNKVTAVGDKMKDIGNTLTTHVTAPIAGVFGAAIKVSADFESSMSNVQAISGATGTEMQALSEKAREMGATTKFSASEAGDAMGYMAMAGWKSEQMISGIDGIMNLAAASGEDLALTSDIVTDALTAFGMSASDSSHFADILAAASSNANTNVSMLGESFKYVAPVAGAMGYSAEDTSVALGLMANSGIKASQAGTSLSTLLTNMANPTANMSTAMQELGVSLDDGAGNMYSFREIMDQLRSGFGEMKMSQSDFDTQLTQLNADFESGKMTEDEYADATERLAERAYGADGALKAQAAAMLAGKTGMSGLLAIVNATDEDYQKLTGAIDGSSEAMAMLADGSIVPMNEALQSGQEIIGEYNGTAEAMAGVMQNNLSGQITVLKSSLEELGIQAGETLIPIAKDLVEDAKNLVTWFQNLDDKTKENIVKFGLLAAAAGPVLSVIGTILSVGGTLLSGIGSIISFWPVITGIASSIGTLITGSLIPAVGGLIAAAAPILAAAAPFIAVGAAIVAVGVLVYKNWDTIKEKAGQLKDALSNKWNEIKTATAEKFESIKATATEKWTNLKSSVSNFTEQLKSDVTGKWENLKQSATEKFENIRSTATSKIESLRSDAASKFESLKSDASTKFENIKSAASTKWEEIKNTIGTAADNIKGNAQRTWDEMKSAYETHGGGLQGAASAMWSGIKNVYELEFNGLNTLTGGKLGELADLFSDLAGKALKWGKDLMDNFIDGVKGKFDDLVNTVSDAAGVVADFLGFSEPDKGPLSDFHTYAPDMMNLFAKGIEDNIRMVEDAASNAAATIHGSMAGSSYTNNVGGVSIVVNAPSGTDVNGLVDMIEDRINRNVMLSARAMG